MTTDDQIQAMAQQLRQICFWSTNGIGCDRDPTGPCPLHETADALEECAAERDALKESLRQYAKALSAASIFASQGHRRWCDVIHDSHLPRVLCTCGLKEYQDAADVIFRAAAEQDTTTTEEDPRTCDVPT